MTTRKGPATPAIVTQAPRMATILPQVRPRAHIRQAGADGSQKPGVRCGPRGRPTAHHDPGTKNSPAPQQAAALDCIAIASGPDRNGQGQTTYRSVSVRARFTSALFPGIADPFGRI